jgi:MFS family permease
VASGAGFLAAVPLGALADRVGAKTTLIGLQVCRAAWFIALAFAHGAVSFTLISVCLTIAQNAVSPATQAVASAAVGDANRVRTMATMRSVRNAGFAIGALLTSPILATNNMWAYRSVVLVDAVSFVGAAILRAHELPLSVLVFRAPRLQHAGALSILSSEGRTPVGGAPPGSPALARHPSRRHCASAEPRNASRRRATADPSASIAVYASVTAFGSTSAALVAISSRSCTADSNFSRALATRAAVPSS